jgi:catechol 2,3-dioxygenase
LPIAHLAHVELGVPDLDASRKWFTDVMGLFVSHETPERVYLRAWQDFDHHTLVLTRRATPGVGHIAWRVKAEGDLDEFHASLTARGDAVEWREGDEPGHGRALRVTAPSGHTFELFHEVERHVAPDELASALPSHPQTFEGNGVAPRRVDHVTILTADVVGLQQWLTDALGIRLNYFAEDEQGDVLGAWMSTTPLTHEIAVMRHPEHGLHHFAYSLDSPDDVIRAARLLVEHGTPIEYGPGIHGTSGGFFLYFREPGGNRIEVWSGAMLLFAPDWEPRRWTHELMRAFGGNMFGSPPPESFRQGT